MCDTFFGHWSVNSLAVDPDKAVKIKNGMNVGEVRDILGIPTVIREKGSVIHYIYGSKWQWHFFTVKFENGAVVTAYEDNG
ncbi:MAG: hypothetical protein LBS59_07055 [Puniceicoccales bacterium]|jgi:outer membrane protein assembly factor BamE (lipoprotein component of BamABCDE complex)|nr:hypothetical protein [Puniceicoccales bacterium]